MNNKVKFLRGTSGEYAVAEKDSDTIYFTTDDGKLYIGDKEVSGSDVTIDDTLSNTSENAVQNKVIKSYVDNSLANIQTALNSKANSEDVYTIAETDTKITEKVAEIVAGAPEDFDTLKEMSDWIESHEGSAAAMNSAINTNAENIVSLQAEIGDIQTVLESVVEVTK